MSDSLEYNELEIEEIDEISAVDNPAQPGARAVIFKRHPLASETPQGVGSNPVNKNIPGEPGAPEETRMTDKTPAEKELDAVKKSLADMTASLEIAKAEGSFSDAERALYRGMDAAGQESFRKMSAEQRGAAVAAAQKADDEVYKALDGTVFRKSDDPRFVALAKRADDAHRALIAERIASKTVELKKRAGDELKNLPGKELAKVALLRAVDGIEDEDSRKEIVALFKAANDAMVGSFSERGTSEGTASGSDADDAAEADEKLMKIAKGLREKDQKLDEFAAYTLAATQNPELYELALGH